MNYLNCALCLALTICTFFSCTEKKENGQLRSTENKSPFERIRDSLIKNNDNSMEYPIQNNVNNITTDRTNRIYLSSSKCQFEILVDDVSLFNLLGDVTKDGSGINGSYDINQLLLSSGQHEVKVRMYPPFGVPVFGDGGDVQMVFSSFENRDLRTELFNDSMGGKDGIHLDQLNQQWVGESGDFSKGTYVEGHYKTKKGLPLKGLPAYEWKGLFKADVPFNYAGWRNSLNLKKEQDDEKKDIFSELMKEYQNIYTIINKKDVNKYLQLVKEREELITSCLFYKDQEKQQRQAEFVNLINNPDYEIEPISETTAKIEFQGYGKLISLTDKTDGEGIIRLRNKKNKGDVVYLDFRFQRKSKSDHLSVI